MMRRCVFLCSQATSAIQRGMHRAPLSITPGTTMEGFECLKVQPMPEMYITGYEFTHVATGARYFHFDTDDTNNAFCIGFCTPAQNNRGTTHVLEHTALCGSKKYPIRDPFFHMLRRSLSTFMNAMTGADYTLYPFATVNAQDYENLLSVYLDAVFYPLLRYEDFRQEGHRLELKRPQEEEKEGEEEEDGGSDNEVIRPEDVTGSERVVFNGVVFNEMKGVISQPPYHFMRELWRSMLPGTHYQHVSGGDPKEVLDLTHEELKQFHQRHYHPSNSVTMTYGDLAPTKHMKTLDALFSQFDKKSFVKVPRLQSENRFSSPKVMEVKGPVDVMGEMERQRKVIVSYALPDGYETPKDMVFLSLLDTLLTSGPSSPMYKSLIESKDLGASGYATMTGYASFLSTPLLSFGVEGLQRDDPAVTQKVEEVVQETLMSSVKEGFDQRRVQATVFQEELSQRHRAADYGVNLVAGLASMCLTRSHLQPMDYLNWVPHLQKATKEPKELLSLLNEITADNKHRVTLGVTADTQYNENLKQEIEEKEKQLNENTPKEKKIEIAKEKLRKEEKMQKCGLFLTHFFHNNNHFTTEKWEGEKKEKKES